MPEEDQVEVLNVLTLLQYQESAIVSRVLLKEKTGNVTVFAFDKDQELSEHTTPFDAMVQVIDGKAQVIIDGESHTLSTGEMTIMPANIPHALYADEKFKMILTMIKKV